jgi:D-beta-D-heptose 7-phosphate kinase/D-beta-D-heptose 1-phosphate adenosyltransferase
LVDPKGINYTKYQSATLLTPNRKEAFEAISDDYQSKDVKEIGEKLMSELNLESLLITQGEDGMTIFERNKNPTHLDALARHVYDVTGAGDTVIATLAVAIAAGANLTDAAKLANIAAGYVVGEVGTTAITFAGLSNEIATK